MPNEFPIGFRLQKIKELGFFYREPLEEIKDRKLDDPIQAKFELNYRWNIEENFFAVQFDYSYFIGSEQNSNIAEFFKLSILVEFQVDNLKSQFTVRSTQDFDIDRNLETTLVSITISTVRGIIYEKSKGTFFEGFMLPLINPSEVILSKKIKQEK